jgi:Flp pilus assembly protein TadG
MLKLRFARRLRRLNLHFLRNRSANVAVIFALMMVPTIFLLGMMLDYTKAYRKQSQLNAAADAAAIAAVTPAMMSQTATAASTAATNVFNATALNLPGLSAPPALSVNIDNNGLSRSVTVSYTAGSVNNFPIVLGSSAWPLSGTSSATAAGAPNINFYLLLDDSPSMAIAGTPAGITTMVNNTSAQGGCGFACHETDPAADNLQNPGGEDNYALARSLDVTLRLDLLVQAVATGSPNLVSTAIADAAKYNTTYQMAIYTFDYTLNTIYAPSGLPSANLSAAGSAASNISMLEVYNNGCLTKTDCNQDTDTNFEYAMQTLNTIMPAPGGGTSTPGDTPQEVLFIVSDGVDDEVVSGQSACSQPIYTYSSPTIYRCQQPFSTTWCTTIKNRGIRIAVLYTEYLQLPTNSWYNSWIAPFDSPTPSTSQIATNLQSCASPGLFYDVASGGDIGTALQNLFSTVVATAAHLTQ